MHNVEDVEPEAVVFADVAIETTFAQLIENKSILVADKADIFGVHLQELLLLAHLRKGIDDDTEQNVKQYDLDEDVETRIMRQLYEVLSALLPVVNLLSVISNASSESQPLVNDREEALEHRLAHVLADPV